jgi:hypothetical protein
MIKLKPIYPFTPPITTRQNDNAKDVGLLFYSISGIFFKDLSRFHLQPRAASLNDAG